MKITPNGKLPEWLNPATITVRQKSPENSIQSPFMRSLPYAIASDPWPSFEDSFSAARNSSPMADQVCRILESLGPEERALFMNAVDLGKKAAVKKLLALSGSDGVSAEVIQTVYTAIREGAESPMSNMVDLEKRGRAVPAKVKNKINKILHEIGGKKWQEIPLDEIFWAARKFGLVPLQEDGTEWSGFLVGGGECGSDEARDQVATFPLATKLDGQWVPTNTTIFLAWCVLGWNPKRYEIVVYMS